VSLKPRKDVIEKDLILSCQVRFVIFIFINFIYKAEVPATSKTETSVAPTETDPTTTECEGLCVTVDSKGAPNGFKATEMVMLALILLGAVCVIFGKIIKKILILILNFRSSTLPLRFLLDVLQHRLSLSTSSTP